MSFCETQVREVKKVALQTMRILLVEDDLLLGQALETGVQQSGYNVDWVTSGESALEALDRRIRGGVQSHAAKPRRVKLSAVWY